MPCWHQRSETDCFELITKGCRRASLNLAADGHSSCHSWGDNSQKLDDRRRKNISWSDDSPMVGSEFGVNSTKASCLYSLLVFRLLLVWCREADFQYQLSIILTPECCCWPRPSFHDHSRWLLPARERFMAKREIISNCFLNRNMSSLYSDRCYCQQIREFVLVHVTSIMSCFIQLLLPLQEYKTIWGF